jgi:hypothetical protein
VKISPAPLCQRGGQEWVFSKKGKSFPGKLMFDIEIGEVYSVNQEIEIGRTIHGI